MRNELSGFLIIDKPAAMSSAQVVFQVKKLLGARKVGHTGTLDPFATGVLICCINQATRLARFFLEGSKTYDAVLRLGVDTDTQDATGQVIGEGRVPPLSAHRLEQVFRRFEGHQMQTPPIYAALKHHGTPLYKLARSGKPVQKPARSITVTALTIAAIALPDVRFEVTCSSGTYVRTLCADIGRAVGCGGHLAGLRRTASSCFNIGDAWTLERINAMEQHVRSERTLIPMAAALTAMPTFTAGEDVLQYVANGRKLTVQQLPPALVEPPSDTAMSGHVKIVDTERNVKAVLKLSPDGAAYDYCCVFN
jgi:tRNA pseudouridine55 synthase